MNFEKAFQLSSFLLILTGFLSLFASEAVGLPLTVGYVAALAVSWRTRPIHLPHWAQFVAFGGLIVLYLVDSLIFTDFLTATVHLLVVVNLIKLFTRKVERDYLILFFISFGFLLFAAAYTISIHFLSTLIAYIFFAILTFILFESRKPYEENRKAHFSLTGYINVALVMTALIIFISMPIFLVIPRISLGFFSVDRQVELNMSGFSEKVSLGDMGEILVGNDIVIRAKVEQSIEGLPADLKWRGIALDLYDGKSWSNTREGFHRLRRNRQWGGVVVAQRRGENDFLVQQTILQEPFSNIVFGMPRMVGLTGDILRGNYVLALGNDSIGVARRSRQLLRYVVHSDVMSREEKLARPVEGTVPDDIRRRYLQLPELNPRVPLLAQEITRGLDDPVRKALAIERSLRERYGYSLENKPAEAEDPLYDFLFATRAGHCEYFATAQAVLMRSLGIPARIVNGFRLGEFNDFSSYFIVRQSDAHSWVEGYFPGPGWIEFDATPPRRSDRGAFTFQRLFTQLLDAVDIFWTEVITFDRIKQVWFFRSVGGKLENTWANLSQLSWRLERSVKSSWAQGLKGWGFSKLIYAALYGGGALLLAVLAWVCYRYRRYIRIFWKAKILGRESAEIAPEYYLEMLHLLGRKGIVKRPAETPAEFASRVEMDLGTLVPAEITHLYYRSRFGHIALAPVDFSKIRGWLRELRR